MCGESSGRAKCTKRNTEMKDKDSAGDEGKDGIRDGKKEGAARRAIPRCGNRRHPILPGDRTGCPACRRHAVRGSGGPAGNGGTTFSPAPPWSRGAGMSNYMSLRAFTRSDGIYFYMEARPALFFNNFRCFVRKRIRHICYLLIDNTTKMSYHFSGPAHGNYRPNRR